MSQECGCRISQLGDHGQVLEKDCIEYCPLHASAVELREALKGALAFATEHLTEAGMRCGFYKSGRAALAASEVR